MHLWFALARVPPPRLQPDKTSGITTLTKSMRVLDGQHVGRGDQVSYPLHLFKERCFRIPLLGDFCEPPIVFLDPFERANCPGERASKPVEGWIWPAPTQSGHIEPSSVRKQHRAAFHLVAHEAAEHNRK